MTTSSEALGTRIPDRGASPSETSVARQHRLIRTPSEFRTGRNRFHTGYIRRYDLSHWVARFIGFETKISSNFRSSSGNACFFRRMAFPRVEADGNTVYHDITDAEMSSTTGVSRRYQNAIGRISSVGIAENGNHTESLAYHSNGFPPTRDVTRVKTVTDHRRHLSPLQDGNLATEAKRCCSMKWPSLIFRA